MRVRLFAPLRVKITSSAQSLVPLFGGPGQGSGLPILTAPHDELASSFDHLVGALLQKQRHVEAECLGGLEVDDQLELDRGLDGKLARLLAPQDAIGIACCASKQIEWLVSIGQQAPEFRKKAIGIDGRETVASR